MEKKGSKYEKKYGYDAYIHIRSPTTAVLKCNEEKTSTLQTKFVKHL